MRSAVSLERGSKYNAIKNKYLPLKFEITRNINDVFIKKAMGYVMMGMIA
jgi:hypothetical protein